VLPGELALRVSDYAQGHTELLVRGTASAVIIELK
jgi:hypothetical protein